MGIYYEGFLYNVYERYESNDMQIVLDFLHIFALTGRFLYLDLSYG